MSGSLTLDPRIATIAGLAPGDLPYFVLASEPIDPTHVATLEGLGLRILRTYQTVDLVAVESDPSAVADVAALPWVTNLSPEELTFALVGEPVVDQTRGTPVDVGAPTWWYRGVAGGSVGIAILDTGIDATHPDLDDLDLRSWSYLLHNPKVVSQRDLPRNGRFTRPPRSAGCDAEPF